MIRCEQVSRSFAGPHGTLRALEGVEFQVEPGEFVAVHGPSGSGKSTLLLTLGGMLRPSSGTVRIAGQDVYALPPSQRDAFRARTIGFVFQLFHLLPYLSVRENILTGLAHPEALPRAREVDALLEQLGLAARRDHPAQLLSAGERQRVALARALLKKPDVLLADEPTGSLDPAHTAAVCRHVADFHRAGGTVVVVSHGPEFSRVANRTLHLESGRLAASPAPSAPRHDP